MAQASKPEAQQRPSRPIRRSDRLSLAVPIQVRGTDSRGVAFDDTTQTLLINRYGAVILLDRPLQRGQEILVRCLGTGREGGAQVIEQIITKKKVGCLYGIEILDPDLNLWEIHFPPATGMEMAAGRLVLECLRCKACEIAYLSVGEVEIFQKNSSVSRPCEHCQDVTVWGEASLRKLKVEPPSTAGGPCTGGATPPVPARTEDMRHEPRVSLSVSGCIRTPQYGEDIVATENLSDAGACFKSAKSYEEGMIVDVAIPYARGRANVFVAGRITGIRLPGVDGLATYGVEYLHAGRRARRVEPTTRITIGFIGSGVRSTGTIIDLSMNGALVRCSERFKVGSPVRMGIALGHETVRLSATAKRDLPGVGAAFEFNQMTRSDRSLLARLILRIESGLGVQK